MCVEMGFTCCGTTSIDCENGGWFTLSTKLSDNLYTVALQPNKQRAIKQIRRGWLLGIIVPTEVSELNWQDWQMFSNIDTIVHKHTTGGEQQC